MEGDLKYQPVFPNGGMGMTAASAKKTRLGAAAAGGETGVYRECLKNHAASLGGHALDGCGEFMPSPEADPADPSSLRCAACGCHRNFHRRLLEPPPPPPLLALPPPPPPPPLAPAAPAAAASSHVVMRCDSRSVVRGEEAPPSDERLPSAFDVDEETEESDEGSDFDEDRPLSPLPAPSPSYRQYQQAAPHVLLALSTGRSAPSPPGAQQTPAAAATPRPPPPASSLGTMPSPASLGPMPSPGTVVPPGASASASAARKRFRTKFSPEQKQRMQALSERLGWRLQKRDEAVVEQCCQEMGVTKGVFKVWMHNNKHNFVAGHSARRSASSSASASAAAAATANAVIHHPSDAAAPASPAAAFHHPPAHAATSAPRPAPVHADFNINGTAAGAADYFRVQPSTASGGSPQSS